VVGVILNLRCSSATTCCGRRVLPLRSGGCRPPSRWLPQLRLFRFKANVIHVIAACAVVGLVVKTLL
jgi:hypothetical protein